MDQVSNSNLTMTGIQTPLFIGLGNRQSRNSDDDGNPIIKLTGNDFSMVSEIVSHRNGSKSSALRMGSNFLSK